MLCVAGAWMLAGCLSCGERTDLPSGFVHVTERVPDAILEVRYHSTYNFVGKRIDGYLAPEAILTEEAAAALRKASDALKERGYRLKIYDAYRPSPTPTATSTSPCADMKSMVVSVLFVALV